MAETPSNKKDEAEEKELIEAMENQSDEGADETEVFPRDGETEMSNEKVSGMDELFAQAETSVEIEGPAAKKKPKQKKPKKSSKTSLLLNQYVLSVMVIFLIIGAIGFFLFLQKDWIKVKSDKMVTKLVEKKLEESLDKYLDSNEKLKGGKRTKIKLSGDTKGENVPGALQDQVETQEDRSEYIIEANRLYEQGDYKTAASLYEKGLDKSMPFLNEDFIVYRLGNCYFNSGDYKEALEVFRHLNNDYLHSEYQLKSRLKMGECYAGLGDYQQARKTLYSVIAQEGNCETEEDKSCVVDSYFKIGDYYLEEAKRLKNVSHATGTTTAVPEENKDHLYTKKDDK